MAEFDFFEEATHMRRRWSTTTPSPSIEQRRSDVRDLIVRCEGARLGFELPPAFTGDVEGYSEQLLQWRSAAPCPHPRSVKSASDRDNPDLRRPDAHKTPPGAVDNVNALAAPASAGPLGANPQKDMTGSL